MPEQVSKRDLTSRHAGEPYLENNGLGSYSIVREGPVGKQTMQVEPELKAAIIKDMQAQRAGGRFGQEDDGMWYPINLELARQISGWQQPEISLAAHSGPISPGPTPSTSRARRRRR